MATSTSSRPDRHHRVRFRTRAAVLEVFKARPSRGGDWRFYAKTADHTLLASGRGYTRKWTAVRGGLRAFPDAQLAFISVA